MSEEKKLKKLLFKGGRVLDPHSKTDAQLDVLVEGSKIAKLGRNLRVPEAKTVSVKNKVVCPGFIDMHVHLREPGQEESETVQTGTAAAAAGGYTGVAAMANTIPVNDNPAVTEAILKSAAVHGSVPVYPIAAITKGLEGNELAEFGLLRDAGAVAFSDDGQPVRSSEVMRRALEYAGGFDMVVIEHCEDKTLANGWVMNEGCMSTRLGLLGVPVEGEEILAARDIILSRLTGSRLHLAHVSSAGTVELVRRAKRDGIRVTAEVTPHHLTLTDENLSDFDTDAKMSPPLRTGVDVDALIEGLQDGTIDCIATDHAPHHPDLKAVEFNAAPFGVVGLETAVAALLDTLVHKGRLDLMRMVDALSYQPASILGLEKGKLAEGARADLSVIDLEREFVVDAAQFKSLSRNTPYKGQMFRGGPA